MSSSPQQDPYLALGITKDADLSAVKTAYRKLVLKCHPDKIQDPTLKAAKQDEFQRVQQAYELLSDDTRRMKYDEQMKLYELRKEMGRGGPPGQSPFDYEIRTAEPRSAGFRSSPKETQRPYGQPSPRAYDEEPRASSFEEPLRARARKTTTTYEDRKRPATRDGERSRRSEEDRDYERWEKERERTMHGAAKKNRDKERRKGAEEKFSRSAGAYAEDDDSDDTYRPRAEAKSSRGPEEGSRARERWARAAEKVSRKEREMDALTERAKKLDINTLKAVQYMEASRRKAEPEMESRPKPVRRAETLQEAAYKIRFAAPPSPYAEDDDSPRRSSAARAVPTRRASEQVPVQSSSSGKERRTSPYDRDPYIVEASPPTPPDPPRRKPPLQSHTSEPPILPNTSRKEPHRSKTFQSEYVRRDSTTAPPPLPRAATFQAGDKIKSSSRGSNLKTQMHYGSDASDSEGYSPRPSSRREPIETTRRYIYDKGRTVPLERYRSALREDNYEDPRDRSESPRGTRRSGADRPSLSRSGGSGTQHSYSRGYSSHSPEPIIKEARPKMPARDSTGSSSSRVPYFTDIKYAPQYGPKDVHYSPDGYRRGSDPTHHRDFPYQSRHSRETAYT
jgi:curved DNA-binding protein CbpA